jgi:hypothetical protein
LPAGKQRAIFVVHDDPLRCGEDES